MNCGDITITQPKFIAFDIGNVLCHVDVDEFIKFLVEQDVAQTYEQANEFMAGIQYPQDLGLYNIRQGFYRFNSQLPHKKLQILHDKWLSVLEPSKPMLEVVDKAIAQGYNVALLSNIGFDHAGVVRHKCDVFNRCIQHFSCEVGARKPAKLFFQSFVLQHGWPKGVLFLDDRHENIDAAKPYFYGIHFDLDLFPSDEEAAYSVKELLELK